jgi:hypothetical protein
MIEVMFSVAVPELVSCTLLAGAVAPTLTPPNATLVADSVNAGAGAMPVPVSPTVCGLPDASSATLTLALRAPAVVGLNCTPKKHEPFALMVLVPNEHAGEPLAGATSAN